MKCNWELLNVSSSPGVLLRTNKPGGTRRRRRPEPYYICVYILTTAEWARRTAIRLERRLLVFCLGDETTTTLRPRQHVRFGTSVIGARAHGGHPRRRKPRRARAERTLKRECTTGKQNRAKMASAG